MFDCSKIPLKDKGCHFIAGFVITLIIGLITSIEYGVLAGVLAGVGKELWDEYSYGGFDKRDMLFTFAGTFAGAIIYGLLV